MLKLLAFLIVFLGGMIVGVYLLGGGNMTETEVLQTVVKNMKPSKIWFDVGNIKCTAQEGDATYVIYTWEGKMYAKYARGYSSGQERQNSFENYDYTLMDGTKEYMWNISSMNGIPMDKSGQGGFITLTEKEKMQYKNELGNKETSSILKQMKCVPYTKGDASLFIPPQDINYMDVDQEYTKRGNLGRDTRKIWLLGR